MNTQRHVTVLRGTVRPAPGQLVPEKMYSTMGSFFKMPQTRDAIAAYVRSYVPLIEETQLQVWKEKH